MPAEQATAITPEVKVVFPVFNNYKHYLDGLYRGIRANLRNWYVNASLYKDGSPLLQVNAGLTNSQAEVEAMPMHQAIVPMWITPQFTMSIGDLLLGIQQTVNALKHTERGRKPLVEKVTAVCPYWEGRADHDPHDDNGGYVVGEAINAEIFAKDFSNVDGMGIDQIVQLGPHSHESVAFEEKQGIKVVPITAAPLFAEHLQTNMAEYGLTRENLQFLALDKGSLEQNIRLCELMGLDPKDHLAVYNKARKGENMVDKCNILYGDPTGKDIVIFDDIIDTYGSMEETVKSLKEMYHCKSITLMVTHGVMSHPARQNIIKGLFRSHSINRIVMTDSLPKPTFMFEELEDQIPIVPTAEIMGEITQYLVETSYDHVMSPESPYANFILRPHNKEEVWAAFRERVGLKEES